VWRQVETDYREGRNEAECFKGVARILSEGVFGYLKKGGLLAAHQPPVAERHARGPTGREVMTPNE